MSTIQLTNQILYNLQAFLERRFVTSGYYYPVTRAEVNPSGIDMSLLQGQTGLSDYSDYQVYQSAFKPWVYETALSIPSGAPALTYPSGVFVDGAFSASGIHYNYSAGQVILDTPLIGTEAVQIGGMTYEQVNVGFPEDELFLLDKTQLKSPTDVSDTVTYPNALQIEPPAVYIEWFDDGTKPLQLGGGRIHHPTVFLHVFATDQFMRNDIVDVLCNLEHSGFMMVDFNTAPARFDVYGDKAVTYQNFPALQTSYNYKTLYFKKITSRNVPMDGVLKRAVIDLELEVYIPEPAS